ncbi:drug/metabolite transporter (DMT)-like permease [Paraburkholderia tropica]|uniref:Drug/metabolite transporter (DMT)-like permease n=2 Tax=Paraburkholderia tropica TaxID=92647 RepID=A0ABX5MLB4_9BURK|nr:drug/metabolite transporter (DMT)-like permease [Paraburkholderia tropica]PZW77949.1 drug/metabolite transporter (DMT)-like permease [Paraburkholderia tropica]
MRDLSGPLRLAHRARRLVAAQPHIIDLAASMNPIELAQLVFLAALWGGSFLFIRVGVTDLGVAPLMALRVGIGALFLLLVLFSRRSPREALGALRERAWPLLVVGFFNSAAPFCLFAWAELTLSAGVTSVINATTPLFGAIVAYFWLKDRLSGLRVAGLVIGFLGVLALVWDQIVTHAGDGASTTSTLLAAGAALTASALYGVAASYTKRHLTGVDPLTVAAGTMTAATLILTPFAIATWPHAAVSMHAWGATLGLGVACTGLAYLLFFRLIAAIGPARTITVTFVIPVFGILWGALFLGEHVSIGMVEACVAILCGTALATGFIKRLPGMGAREHRASAKH